MNSSTLRTPAITCLAAGFLLQMSSLVLDVTLPMGTAVEVRVILARVAQSLGMIVAIIGGALLAASLISPQHTPNDHADETRTFEEEWENEHPEASAPER